MRHRAKVVIAGVGLALSLAVAAASTWVAFGQGRDDGLPAPASSVWATTTEAESGTTTAPAGRSPAAETTPSGTDEGERAEASPAAADAATPDEGRGAQDAPVGTTPDVGAGAVVAEVDQPEDVLGASSADVRVSLTVDASSVGAGTSTSAVTLAPGCSAYDALVASGADVNARATGFGTYVAAINGVAEKEHGGMSGWVYSVNGIEPNTSASTFLLADGDAITWTYVNVEY